MSLLNTLYNLLGDGWVLLNKGCVHRDDAAWLVSEVLVQQGTDAFELSFLYQRVSKGIGEQRGGNLAVFHRSHAGVGADLHQVDVGLRVDAVRIQQQAGDVVVGSADAVWNGNGGAFQVLGGVVFAVSQNVQGFASDVRAADEGQVNVVGGRNQHGGDVAYCNLRLVGAQRLGVGGTFEALSGQAGLFIVAKIIRNGWTGSAAVGHVVEDRLAISGLCLHSSLLFSGWSQVADFLSAAVDAQRNKHLVPLAGGGSLEGVHVFGVSRSGSAVRNGAGQLLGAGFAPQHGVGHSSGILYDRNGAAFSLNRIAYRVVRDDLVRANWGPGFLHDLVNGQFGVGDQAQTQVVLGDLAQGSLGEGVGQAEVQGIPALDVFLKSAGELAVLDHEVDSVLGVQTVVHTSALNSHGDVFCVNRVLLQEVVVHRHDAAGLVLESRVGGQRDDRTQSAVLHHVVSPDVAEDGSINFAVFHRCDGCGGLNV